MVYKTIIVRGYSASEILELRLKKQRNFHDLFCESMNGPLELLCQAGRVLAPPTSFSVSICLVLHRFW